MELLKAIAEARKERGYPDADISDIYYDELVNVFKKTDGYYFEETDDGFLAGFITDNYMLMPGSMLGIVVSYYVKPESRNKGIGNQLIENFTKWAKDQDCEYIMQGTPTRDSVEVGRIYLREVR